MLPGMLSTHSADASAVRAILECAGTLARQPCTLQECQFPLTQILANIRHWDTEEGLVAAGLHTVFNVLLCCRDTKDDLMWQQEPDPEIVACAQRALCTFPDSVRIAGVALSVMHAVSDYNGVGLALVK